MLSVLGADLKEAFDRAATGDADAQSELVQYSLNRISEGAVTFEHGVQVAEAFARLAAAHRRPSGLMALASVLMQSAQVCEARGEYEESVQHQAEGLAILSDLADAGHEVAAVAVQEASSALSPIATIMAGHLLRQNAALEAEAADEDAAPSEEKPTASDEEKPGGPE